MNPGPVFGAPEPVRAEVSDPAIPAVPATPADSAGGTEPASGAPETAGTPEPTPGRVRTRTGVWLIGFWVLSVVVGAVVGVVWEAVTPLPAYTVGSNGVATTSERGLAAMFGSDAWFCLLGFWVCVGLGVIAWRWFHPLGWPTVPVAITGALAAAGVCWWVGYHLGPSSFVDRMAAAKAGAVVPVQLTLKTKASLVIWAFGVVIPILLRSSLGRDEEDQSEPAPKKTARADPAA